MKKKIIVGVFVFGLILLMGIVDVFVKVLLN